MKKRTCGLRGLIGGFVVLVFFAIFTLPSVFAADDVVDSVVERVLWVNDTVKVIVDLKEDTPLTTIGDEVKVSTVPTYDRQDINVTQVFTTLDGFAAEVTDEGLKQLKENPAVEGVYIDRPVRAFLTSSVPLINASSTWSILMNASNVTGAGQTVCIIDTGIDYTHSSLGGCTASQFLAGTCSKIVSGYDFSTGDNDPADDHGHGTHVAGIVAANGAVRGVAPDAKLVAIKSLDSGGSGFTSDVIAGIEWCTNNATKYNISVISMSLGGSTRFSTYCDSSDSLMAEAINAAVGRNISVVVATGNAGSSTGISSPACIFNSTAVASTTKSDGMSSFSNTNSITDIAAPGSSITSATSA